MSTQEERNVPQVIKFESIVEDVCFHPEKDVIAAGDIDGQVTLHSYSLKEENHLLMNLGHHKKACRALKFNPSGSSLYTVSKDKSLQKVDMEQGVVTHKIKKAHEEAIYSLLVIDDNMLATGDDDGTVKVWDMRQQKAVMDVKEHEEFISDMVIDPSKRYLLTSSGDGTITVFDARKHKMKMQSEMFDSELLSLAIVKGGEKVVCGTGDGVINIFNWNEWGNLSDRFPGHPDSIDCILTISPDVIVTGSQDGVIRAVNILPNRLLGVVGEHKDFPVENLSLSRCGTFIASCSHDQKIKFWNTEGITDVEVDASSKVKRGGKIKKFNAKGGASADDFFSDLVEPKTDDSEKNNESGVGSDSDDNDDSDSEKGSEIENASENASGISDSDNDSDDSDKSPSNSDSKADSKSST